MAITIKNKKNKLAYITSFLLMVLGGCVSGLSYINSDSSINLSLIFDNSTVSNSTMNEEDFVKNFIFSHFNKKDINFALGMIIVVLSVPLSVFAYLNTKLADEKTKTIENLNTELETLTNQARSVQLNIPHDVNVEGQYVPSRIHSYDANALYAGASRDAIIFDGARSDAMNEPTFELNSNTLIDSGSQPTAYPTPIEIN